MQKNGMWPGSDSILANCDFAILLGDANGSNRKQKGDFAILLGYSNRSYTIAITSPGNKPLSSRSEKNKGDFAILLGFTTIFLTTTNSYILLVINK